MAIGKTPPGSTTSPQVSRELPKSEQRKLKGVFQSSGGARDVAPHPGETHIPPNSEGFPQERPLDDWDIKVQEVENRYIDSAAHFSGQPFTEEQRPDLKHAIKELHVNIFDMLNRYNQRVAALLVENRIAKKDADAVVRPLVRDLMPLVEELKGLEKSLDANASKSARKDVKTALKAAKKNLDKARPMLVEAKVLLAEATRVAPEPVPGEKPVVKKYPEPVVPPPAKKPEKAQVSPTKKTAPVKKTKKNGQSNISPELRLAEIMKELGRSRKAPRLQETIETTFECLQEILEHKFPGWIRERVEQGADPEELAAYQSAFARSFSQVQAMTSSPVASDNVAIHRENLKDQIFACQEIIGRTRGQPEPAPKVVQPEPVRKARGHLIPSQIASPALREKVIACTQAVSPPDRQKAILELHQYLQQQHQRFDRLQTVFTVIHAKSHFQGEDVPEECTAAYSALSKLSDSVQKTGKLELDEAWISAITQADQALVTLEQFDHNPPESVIRVLTSFPDTSGYKPHLLNLMCRTLLNEETGPLTGRSRLARFESVQRYLEETQEARVHQENAYTAYRAFLDIVGEVFVNPAELRALMNEAKTLEEIHDVGLMLREWRERQGDLLKEISSDLDQIEMDFQLEGIKSGDKAMDLLVRRFPEGIREHAGSTAEERLLLLESALNRALTEVVDERVANTGLADQFRTSKQLCKKLEKEINSELGSLARVSLTPGVNEGEVFSSVTVRLLNVEKDGQQFDEFINGPGPVCAAVRSKMTQGQGSRLVALDGNPPRWHWVRHSAVTLDSYREDFVELFEKYHEAVGLVKKNNGSIKRHVRSRMQVDKQVTQIRQSIPGFKSLMLKIRGRVKQRRAKANLAQLNTTLDDLGKRPLVEVSEETSRIRDQVIAMVKASQFHNREAIAILEPLYELRRIAESRTSARASMIQPVRAEGVALPESLHESLQQMDQKLRPKAFYRIFQPKRLQTYQFALSLVAICEACPHGALLNAQLLDQFAEELKRSGKKYPDHKHLASALGDYANALQKGSRPIDPMLAMNTQGG